MNVGGDHPGRIGIGVGVDNMRRVKTPDPPRCLDLPREPFTELLVVGKFGMDDFHRDLATAGRYAQEHTSHPAAAQPPDQPVPADLARITAHKKFHVPPHPS